MSEYLMKKIGKCVEYINNHKLEGPAINALKKTFERPGLIDITKLMEICKQLEQEFTQQSDEVVEPSSPNGVAAFLKGVKVLAKELGAFSKGIVQQHNELIEQAYSILRT